MKPRTISLGLGDVRALRVARERTGVRLAIFHEDLAEAPLIEARLRRRDVTALTRALANGVAHVRLFVLVDRHGRPHESAGPAPFEAVTRREAAAEAARTVGPLRALGARVVPLTPKLERALAGMAAAWGLR